MTASVRTTPSSSPQSSTYYTITLHHTAPQYTMWQYWSSCSSNDALCLCWTFLVIMEMQDTKRMREGAVYAVAPQFPVIYTHPTVYYILSRNIDMFTIFFCFLHCLCRIRNDKLLMSNITSPEGLLLVRMCVVSAASLITHPVPHTHPATCLHFTSDLQFISLGVSLMEVFRTGVLVSCSISEADGKRDDGNCIHIHTADIETEFKLKLLLSRLLCFLLWIPSEAFLNAKW